MVRLVIWYAITVMQHGTIGEAFHLICQVSVSHQQYSVTYKTKSIPE